jgi:LPXTG-motif cell wall-anchored protein
MCWFLSHELLNSVGCCIQKGGPTWNSISETPVNCACLLFTIHTYRAEIPAKCALPPTSFHVLKLTIPTISNLKPTMAPNPEAHYGRGGWRCGPPGDRRRRWCDDPSNSASGFATPTVASDVLPTGASLVNANSNSNSNSLNPIAVIVPTLVGAALLILAIGGFFIWRRRRREAAAAAAASSSGSNSGTSERGGMRGGALGGVVDEKVTPHL